MTLHPLQLRSALIRPATSTEVFLGFTREAARHMHDCVVWRLHRSPDVPHVVCLQAPMFKAPAFAYAPGASDFLLLRHASGRMALRRFQGAVALGQQEPHVRVPAPQSKEKR
jgi:Protein of unknown function (DUF3591)